MFSFRPAETRGPHARTPRTFADADPIGARADPGSGPLSTEFSRAHHDRATYRGALFVAPLCAAWLTHCTSWCSRGHHHEGDPPSSSLAALAAVCTIQPSGNRLTGGTDDPTAGFGGGGDSNGDNGSTGGGSGSGGNQGSGGSSGNNGDAGAGTTGGGATPTPAPQAQASLAKGLAISEVAVFQGVKVSVAKAGAKVTTRKMPVRARLGA